MWRRWPVVLALALLVAALMAVEYAASRHPHVEAPVAASPSLAPAPPALPESGEADPSTNPALMR